MSCSILLILSFLPPEKQRQQGFFGGGIRRLDRVSPLHYGIIPSSCRCAIDFFSNLLYHKSDKKATVCKNIKKTYVKNGKNFIICQVKLCKIGIFVYPSGMMPPFAYARAAVPPRSLCSLPPRCGCPLSVKEE